MIPRPSRSGESLFMTSLETSQILLFLYHCPHPYPRSLTPIPSPRGEGDFGGGESLRMTSFKTLSHLLWAPRPCRGGAGVGSAFLIHTQCFNNTIPFVWLNWLSSPTKKARNLLRAFSINTDIRYYFITSKMLRTSSLSPSLTQTRPIFSSTFETL